MKKKLKKILKTTVDFAVSVTELSLCVTIVAAKACLEGIQKLKDEK